MGIVTGQQLARFYAEYRDREITFNRQIIEVLKLVPKEIYLKCQGDQLPCVIYSSSMAGAKIVANLKDKALQQIRLAGSSVSLRFAFQRSDKTEPLFFFIPAKVTNYTFYRSAQPDLYFLSLDYTKKPPDDLIEMLGQVLEASTNFTRRKEERIQLDPVNIKTMGIEGKEATLIIGKQAKKCIIRDLSFSGAKVLLFGARSGEVRNPAVLQFFLSTQKQKILLPGTVVRFEEVVGREDIGAYGIRFIEEKTPMSYKILVNNTLKTIRRSREQH